MIVSSIKMPTNYFITRVRIKLVLMIAVRTGIEPVATDRQSAMLAFTPTNHLSDKQKSPVICVTGLFS